MTLSSEGDGTSFSLHERELNVKHLFVNTKRIVISH